MISKELESFGVLRLKVGLSLKVFLKVLTVVMAEGNRRLSINGAWSSDGGMFCSWGGRVDEVASCL